MIHDGNAVRKGRHCRERWYNHVDPSLKKGKWTVEEDHFIIEQQSLLGNHWSEISKKMQGRTENSVKNRYKSLLRKKKGLDSNDDSFAYNAIDEKETEIEMQPPNFNSLLLFSPKIVNFDICESLHDNIQDPMYSPIQNFVRPTPIIMRPITDRIPGMQKINSAKEKLKQVVMLEGNPSPLGSI